MGSFMQAVRAGSRLAQHRLPSGTSRATHIRDSALKPGHPAGLKLKVYFANPHAPWERGVNENTNGLLRDYFPKGSDFSAITPARLANVQRMLNNRPRKCLNYRTPIEVLNALPGVALRN